MNNRLITLWLTLVSISIFAQEQQKDSIVNPLTEVIVTGQFEAQSLKKSVYNVRVITKEDIKKLAANNLGDVLNQYLNISIKTSGSDGRSTVSMFGLDAQYFKILVDNIPLVSDTGLGNNIDLTQVNLDDIEQIEIIEGSMGVTHGANAVSGILNIITKKRSHYNWEIATTLQEETVSDEFALFNKGRHIQSLKISNSISKEFFATVGINRNDFAGFFDDRQGRDYAQNDGLRGYSWLPKEQLTTNAFIGYSKPNYKVFYKFDYFGENVDFYNQIVAPKDNYPFPNTNFSQDRRYISSRFYHHLNSYGTIFSTIKYNISLSHQKQERDIEKFNYGLETHQETLNKLETFQSKEVLYSTGTLNNFLNTKMFNLQLGYELVNENGFYDATAGTFKNDQQQANDIRKRFENYDLFAVSELNVTERFSIRPGFRYSFQSQFDNQFAASVGFRYNFNQGIQVRASVGRSYRTPNFDELYTYFVDSNHNLQGNPYLTPETSWSYEASVKKVSYLTSGLQLSHNLSVAFMNVDDRINLVLEQVTPTQNYKYLNIDTYKMWNISTSHQAAYKNWNASLGMALVGISQEIDLAALNVTSDDNFLYAFQLNTSASYKLPKWNTLFSVYYKFNGKDRQYISSSDAAGNATFILSEVASYGWMDASIRQSFFKEQFEVTLGSRNIFDVTELQASQSGSTGIHAANSGILLGYGRSYFLKLTYNLNFN
ncbi:TonB-dependent receptor plug domain-containing protein [Flavobacterium hiemivividum]|uniref:TonB-dependent receptor n=1 Tax=Flavobacterium hiemivividum TaxID=2541734 RepID=A0A4R5CVZ0_9FLAO|nr:TonB-dependent receptor [Flavobacterium hiemivividum]TDE02684.1 TonB-dependent receptor [Flavobacterium hiemivividum]